MQNYTYPPYSELSPEDEYPSLEYYNDDGGYCTPKRHWCLVAEIVENHTFMRHRQHLILRTRLSLDRFQLVFYLDKEPASTDSFNYDQLKVGNTICVLYAERKRFLDGTQGIRQESADCVHVFKAPLHIVHEEAKKLLQYADTRAAKAKAVSSTSSSGAGSNLSSNTVHPFSLCFICGKQETAEAPLSRCAGCHIAVYCSKECQKSHWNLSHKALCKDSEKLLRLSCLPRYPFVELNWFKMHTLPPHKLEN